MKPFADLKPARRIRSQQGRKCNESFVGALMIPECLHGRLNPIPLARANLTRHRKILASPSTSAPQKPHPPPAPCAGVVSPRTAPGPFTLFMLKKKRIACPAKLRTVRSEKLLDCDYLAEASVATPLKGLCLNSHENLA